MTFRSSPKNSLRKNKRKGYFMNMINDKDYENKNENEIENKNENENRIK